MAEKNNNLEFPEKKLGKSWVFRIALFLIVLAIGLTIWGITRPCHYPTCEPVGTFFFLYLILIVLFLPGILIILIHFFLEFRKRRNLPIQLFIVFIILIISCFILNVFWGDQIAKIFTKIAITTNNDFFCSAASGRKDTCYLEFARNKKDPMVCGKMVEYWKCYSDIAKLTKDEAICGKIGSTSGESNKNMWASACYYSVAQIKKDETICENIGNSNLRYICYDRVAAVKNPVICEKLPNEKWINSCISHSEKSKSGNITNCENNDECFLEAALARTDSGLCEKIKDSFNRAICYEAF